MPYIHKKIKAGNTIEHRKYYNGRYKVQIKNAPKEKATPQNQKDYQDRAAEQKIRHLIHENFYFGDYWATLCYPAWVRPAPKQVKKDIERFLDKLRRKYKAQRQLLKYIYTAGRGERGAIHFHIVLNCGVDPAVVSECWWDTVGTGDNPYPRVHFRTLDKSGYYGRIAAYLIKNSRETFWSEERIHGRRYCASANLKKPEIKREIVSARTWREEPKVPKGYYLLKDSLHSGIDKENGYPYQEYIFVRLQSVDPRKGEKANDIRAGDPAGRQKRRNRRAMAGSVQHGGRIPSIHRQNAAVGISSIDVFN